MTTFRKITGKNQTTWVAGTGECYGIPTKELQPGDVIFMSFKEPETVSEIVNVVDDLITFTTSWKDINGKPYSTIYEKPVDEIIVYEFEEGKGPKLTGKTYKEYLQTKTTNKMTKTDATKAFRARFSALQGKQKDVDNPAVLGSVLKKVKNDTTLQKMYDNLEDFVSDFDEEFKNELAKVKNGAPAEKKDTIKKAKDTNVDPWMDAVDKVKDEKSFKSLLKKVQAEKKTIIARRGDLEVTYDSEKSYTDKDRLVVVFTTKDGEIRKSYVDAFKRFFLIR